MICTRTRWALALLLLLLLCSCEKKESTLSELFGKRPLTKRVEELKPNRPPGVRRDSAYWFLSHTHKLTDEQQRLVVPLFAELLQVDEDRLVRGYAAGLLGKLRDPEALPALTKALADDRDAMVRIDIIKAMAQYNDKSLLPELTRASQTDRDADVRQAALEAIVQLGGKEAIPPLIDALGDRSTDVVFSASRHLAELTGENLGMGQDRWRTWWRENANKALPPRKAPGKGKGKKKEEEKGEKKKKKKHFLLF